MGVASDAEKQINKKNSSMLLITNGFPYKGGELSFLQEEYKVLKKHFEISIMALETETTAPIEIDIDPDIIVESIAPIRLNPVKMFLQLFQKNVIIEIKEALKGCSIALKAKRVASILMYEYKSKAYFDKISELHKKRKLDIIYTFWYTPATYAAMKFSDANSLKFVSRFHGGDLYLERVNMFGYYFPFRKQITEKASKLIFLSDMAREYYSIHWMADQKKCMVSPLGTRGFEPLPKSIDRNNFISLVTAANAISLKRIDLIINAIAAVDSSYEIIWSYFGDGEKLELLREYAGTKLNRPNISWQFYGRVSNEGIYDFYKQVDASAFILLSSTEGVPVSIEEALGMGLPIIATDVGGVREEVIEGKTGFLLSENPTCEDVARTIEKFIRLPQETKLQMHKNAIYLWKEKYDAEKNAAKLAQFLEAL